MKISNTLSVYEIYDTISREKGKVVGKDIISTVETLDEMCKTERALSEEMAFYKQQVRKFMEKGMTCITYPEFEEYLEKGYPEGVLTREIKKKVSALSYISLVKLLKMVNSEEELKGKLLRSSQVFLSSLQHSQIFDGGDEEIGPEVSVAMILNYMNDTVVDACVRANL
jgi:hypothetical protein